MEKVSANIGEKDNLGKAAQMAAEMQKAQLKEATDKHLRHIEDDILEGEMLRQKAAEDLRGERLAEKKRRQQAVQALAETQKANAYLKQLRAEDELREQREEEKIREYALRKERVLELRKKREEEVFQAKQAHKQRMIDKQVAQLAAMKSNEDERLVLPGTTFVVKAQLDMGGGCVMVQVEEDRETPPLIAGFDFVEGKGIFFEFSIEE